MIGFCADVPLPRIPGPDSPHFAAVHAGLHDPIRVTRSHRRGAACAGVPGLRPARADFRSICRETGPLPEVWHGVPRRRRHVAAHLLHRKEAREAEDRSRRAKGSEGSGGSLTAAADEGRVCATIVAATGSGRDDCGDGRRRGHCGHLADRASRGCRFRRAGDSHRRFRRRPAESR